MNNDQVYKTGANITAAITFVGTWIYCIAHYGFLLGVGLGWLPAIITAVIAGLLWPLALLALALGGVFILFVIFGKI